MKSTQNKSNIIRRVTNASTIMYRIIWRYNPNDNYNGYVSVRDIHIQPLKPSGHYMYGQFNIQQFYVLSTQ